MSKKYDESELYREKILESGISEKELQKLVKEKKSDLKKNLGKHGKIDDKSALFLIAKERGIVLISSSTIVLEDKSDFERYLDYRDSTRETCLYLINTLEPKIDDLIKQVEKIEVAEKLVIATKNSNQTMIDFLNNKEYDELGIEYLDRSIASTEFIHHDLLMVKKYIDSLLIPSLFKNDEDYTLYIQNKNGIKKTDSFLVMKMLNDGSQYLKEVNKWEEDIYEYADDESPIIYYE